MDISEAFVKIGEMIKERYQIVTDIGFNGDNETTEAWLSFIFQDVEDDDDYNYVEGKKVTLCLIASEQEQYITMDIYVENSKDDDYNYSLTERIKVESIESNLYKHIISAMHQIDLMIDSEMVD